MSEFTMILLFLSVLFPFHFLLGDRSSLLFHALGDSLDCPALFSLCREFAVQCLHRNGSKFSARILMLGSEDGCPVFLIKGW
mgnify:CR=1 FL=1